MGKPISHRWVVNNLWNIAAQKGTVKSTADLLGTSPHAPSLVAPTFVRHLRRPRNACVSVWIRRRKSFWAVLGVLGGGPSRPSGSFYMPYGSIWWYFRFGHDGLPSGKSSISRGFSIFSTNHFGYTRFMEPPRKEPIFFAQVGCTLWTIWGFRSQRMRHGLRRPPLGEEVLCSTRVLWWTSAIGGGKILEWEGNCPSEAVRSFLACGWRAPVWLAILLRRSRGRML